MLSLLLGRLVGVSVHVTAPFVEVDVNVSVGGGAQAPAAADRARVAADYRKWLDGCDALARGGEPRPTAPTASRKTVRRAPARTPRHHAR